MYSSLSPKEKRVYDLIIKGESQKEIANKLFVSHSTVKFHTNNIRKKFSVLTTNQVIANHYTQQTDNCNYEYRYHRHGWAPCTLIIAKKDNRGRVVVKAKHTNCYLTVDENHVRQIKGD